MCIILDTNLYRDFNNLDNEDMQPVRDWIDRKNGKIAYSPVGKIKQELEKSKNMIGKFRRYKRDKKLIEFSKEEVEQAKKGLKGLTSDDPGIIALAQISSVKLLATRDKNLQGDFKKIIKGKVYQTKKHKHLLRKDTCPLNPTV